MVATEAFRNNLKHLIDSGEASPTAIKEVTGISRSSIQGWIKGENSPNLEQVQRIAAALGRTVGELLTGELAPPSLDERKLLLVEAVLRASKEDEVRAIEGIVAGLSLLRATKQGSAL